MAGGGGTRVDGRRRRALAVVVLGLAGLAGLLVAVAAGTGPAASPAAAAGGSSSGTVWLCRPGAADDPCASGLAATSVPASGPSTVQHTAQDPSSPFDCFYVYPTVSFQQGANANLKVQASEVSAAIAQVGRFSSVCRVWAPMYRQVTLAELSKSPGLRVPAHATAVAYDSLRSAFEDYLAHDNHGRPIIFIGHSQGSTLLIQLLRHFVDGDPSLRRRLVLAILPGGNVEVRTGARTGGSFAHIPTCDAAGETGCVIAYSSFPGTPPAGALFGRPGQGASLQSGQTATHGVQVACVNPAALAGGSGTLSPYFPSLGKEPTPWVTYPGLYTARCEHADGATWLEVQVPPGAAGSRPVVTEDDGPEWGYHESDVNLALGNLTADVARAEQAWTADRRGRPR